MRYLLAVDLYQDADQVADAARNWVQGTHHVVDLVYVPPSIPMAWGRHTTPESMAQIQDTVHSMRARAAVDLEALLGRLPEANRGSSEVTDPGSPAAILLERSATHDAVMVGTHGRSSLSRLVLGSVADRLIREAASPVVVLRVA